MKTFIKITAATLLFCVLLAACGNKDIPVNIVDNTAHITNQSGSSNSQSSAAENSEYGSAAQSGSSSAPESSKSTSTVLPSHIAVNKITLSTYKVNITVGQTKTPIVTMSPKNATNKAEIWASSNTKIATVNKYGKIKGIAAGKCTVTVTSADNKKISAAVAVTVTKSATNSTSSSSTAIVKPTPETVKSPTYIGGVLIVNKSYPLPKNYYPGVVPEAKTALDKMFAAAKKDGYTLKIKSGFRSYATQKTLYNRYVKSDGKAAADRYSARPGYSEHQTGLAFDINKADSSFDNTKEAKWLAANAYKYGFILRYPKGKESVTGYIYESWHYRYVGIEMAEKIYKSGKTLEEYFGITSKY